MKRSELAFNILSIPVDALMLVMSGLTAFYLRLHYVDLIGPVLYQLDVNDFLMIAFKIIPIVVVIFAFSGLYHLKGTRKFREEFFKIVVGICAGLSIAIILFFFDQTVFPSRFIMLATAFLSIIYLSVARLLERILQTWFFKKGYGLHRVILIDGDKYSKTLIQNFKDEKLGYKIVEEINDHSNITKKLETIFAKFHIDEIIQSNPTLGDEVNLEILAFARNRGALFSFVPNLFEMQRNVVEVESIRGIPLIAIKNTPLDGWGRVAKRLIDVTLSLIALIILSPVILLLFIAIKLDSKGPAIYSALRGGHGKDFKFYKFRSMYAHMSPGLGGEEAEKLRQKLWETNDRGGKEAPFLKIKDDPRVTRIGKIIRKTKLDEVPQFWNVLIGDMSLVGPRAHVLDEVQRYRDSYQRMFSIKPGIFGLSQLAQVTWPDLPFEEEIRLNTYYIENWSLQLDIRILFNSLWRLIFGGTPSEDY